MWDLTGWDGGVLCRWTFRGAWIESPQLPTWPHRGPGQSSGGMPSDWTLRILSLWGWSLCWHLPRWRLAAARTLVPKTIGINCQTLRCSFQHTKQYNLLLILFTWLKHQYCHKEINFTHTEVKRWQNPMCAHVNELSARCSWYITSEALHSAISQQRKTYTQARQYDVLPVQSTTVLSCYMAWHTYTHVHSYKTQGCTQ